MGKFNDSYLKPALDSLEGSAESHLNSANSITNRVNAESDAVRDKSKAERIFRENLSIGYKVLLILIGIGFLSLLLAWAASIVIKALKDETTAIEKIKVIEEQAVGSEQRLQALSNSMQETRNVFSSELKNYFDGQSKLLSELSTKTSQLSANLDKVQNEVVKSQSEKSEIATEPTPNYSGYTLQKFNLNTKSMRCYENGSYSSRCIDKVEFSNGWSYSGSWLNGQPDGKGTLTFPGGAKMAATWKNGVPTSVQNDGLEEADLLKSITYFQSVSAKKINSGFRDVVIGYRFDTGADQTWKSAYCYLEVAMGGDDLTVSLSNYSTFNGKVFKNQYAQTSLYSRTDFISAQALCKYKRSGFN